jgi:hypothetical protein
VRWSRFPAKAAWVGDHGPLHRTAGLGERLVPNTLWTPSPFPVLAAAAGVTSALRVRTWVIAAPLRSSAAVVRNHPRCRCCPAADSSSASVPVDLTRNGTRPARASRGAPVSRRIDQAAQVTAALRDLHPLFDLPVHPAAHRCPRWRRSRAGCWCGRGGGARWSRSRCSAGSTHRRPSTGYCGHRRGAAPGNGAVSTGRLVRSGRRGSGLRGRAGRLGGNPGSARGTDRPGSEAAPPRRSTRTAPGGGELRQRLISELKRARWVTYPRTPRSLHPGGVGRGWLTTANPPPDGPHPPPAAR